LVWLVVQLLVLPLVLLPTSERLTVTMNIVVSVRLVVAVAMAQKRPLQPMTLAMIVAIVAMTVWTLA
jgi:hypothetical protein